MDPHPYYGPYRPVETWFNLVLGAGVPVCAENFNRVALLFGVGAQQTINLSTKPTVTSTTGMSVVGGTPGPIGFTFADYGPLIGQQWFAATNAPVTLTVIEIIRDRDMAEKWQVIPELQSAESESQDVFNPLG